MTGWQAAWGGRSLLLPARLAAETSRRGKISSPLCPPPRYPASSPSLARAPEGADRPCGHTLSSRARIGPWGSRELWPLDKAGPPLAGCMGCWDTNAGGHGGAGSGVQGSDPSFVTPLPRDYQQLCPCQAPSASTGASGSPQSCSTHRSGRAGAGAAAVGNENGAHRSTSARC